MIDEEAIKIIGDTLNVDIRMAERVMRKLMKLGYHKVTGEPPVLSDEEMISVEERIQDDLDRREKMGKIWTATDRVEATIRAIAQAQRNADVKFQGGLD